MRVIGIDPGYATIGWGVLNYNNFKFEIIAHGAITTPADMLFCDRLVMLYSKFYDILNLYKPDCMSIERLFFSSNKKTAIDVAQARGVLLFCAKGFGIDIFEYSPLQVKKGITGLSRAAKSQVMYMTKNILNLKKMPKPDDVADALALAVVHIHTETSGLVGAQKIYDI